MLGIFPTNVFPQCDTSLHFSIVAVLPELLVFPFDHAQHRAEEVPCMPAKHNSTEGQQSENNIWIWSKAHRNQQKDFSGMQGAGDQAEVKP